jgi:hypothetical protein
MTQLSESFYITLIATVSAILTLSLRMCLRSRCSDVECLCFKIRRDVDLESQEQTHLPQINREMSNVDEKINL